MVIIEHNDRQYVFEGEHSQLIHVHLSVVCTSHHNALLKFGLNGYDEKTFLDVNGRFWTFLID